MTVTLALLASALFLLTSRLLKLNGVMAHAGATVQRSFTLLKNPLLSDLEKERIARAEAMRMLGFAGRFLGLSLLALVLPAAIVMACVRGGFVAWHDLSHAFLSPWIFAASLVMMLGIRLFR